MLKKLLLSLFLFKLLVQPSQLFAETSDTDCTSALAELSSASNGSFIERESKLKAIIQKCPSLAEAHFNLGVLLLENSQSANAIVEFEKALSFREQVDYRLALASALVVNGDLLTAKSVYENIIAKDPKSVTAFIGLATVYEKQAKLPEALDALNKAYVVNPDDLFVNYNLGVLYGRLEQLDASIISYERALRTNPKHFSSQFYLGLALKKAGRDVEALSALKKASEFDDASIDSIRAYAFELEEDGSLDEAEVILRRALSKNVGNQELNEQLILVLLRKNQDSNAKPLIEQILAIKPGDPRMLALYGWTQMRLGDLVSAEKALKEAIAKDPNSAFGFFALGELYRQSGQPELAKNSLETAYKIEPALQENSEKWWQVW